MELAATVVTRSRHLDEIAEGLPQRAGALSRLFLSQSRLGISRIEAGVMRAVAERPQRITELAAAEGVTQPAITRLVDRLQDRGWVTREPHPEDGRVVMVRLTTEGEQMLGALSAEYRALVHEEMAVLPDADVETLARAIDVLDALIARLVERES
jgi:DNA-binding MarR family transcriptional regulator